MTQPILCVVLGMFVRKKKNKSGVISVQIITKVDGKSRLVKTIGSSANADEVERLVKEGRVFIHTYAGQQKLDFSNTTELIKSAFTHISSLTEVGTELLLGRIFDDIGFNRIAEPLFRKLVFARLSNPVSKLKTSAYLLRHKNIEVPVQQIYRYMDKLHSSQKQEVEAISYQHTLKVLNNRISVVFYDVTTLYFEIDNEDDLRKTGFSKEGKHQNPQIVLGLLVGAEGYPLAYDLFEGNKFEGHTMLPVIDAFKRKYGLDKLIVIADSGLLSSANVEELINKGYEFILGARIKSEPEATKQKILALQLQNGQSAVLERGPLKLVVSYADSRAKKDRYNREKGLAKLEKRVKTGRLTKANINNRGYNKYLKLQGEVVVDIDYEKYIKDAQWDGLKGYITNSTMDKEQIIDNYRHLWQIEKAFRIAKSDLKIRPVYHRISRRIEAHICISFAAYKVYKELERQLRLLKAGISPENALDIAKSIFMIEAKTPNSRPVKHLLLLNDEQRFLAELFQFGDFG